MLELSEGGILVSNGALQLSAEYLSLFTREILGRATVFAREEEETETAGERGGGGGGGASMMLEVRFIYFLPSFLWGFPGTRDKLMMD